MFRIDKDTKQHVNISGGPLAYRYQFEEIYIHYGIENSQGSEHKIHGYHFPGEVSVIGFDSNLKCFFIFFFYFVDDLASTMFIESIKCIRMIFFKLMSCQLT